METKKSKVAKELIFKIIFIVSIAILPTELFSSSFCRGYADQETSWFESRYEYEWDKNYDYCKYYEDELIRAYERDRDNFFPLFIVDIFENLNENLKSSSSKLWERWESWKIEKYMDDYIKDRNR